MPGFWDYIQPPAPKPAPSQHRCDDYKCDECNGRYCEACGFPLNEAGDAHGECRERLHEQRIATMDRHVPGMMRK